MKRNWKKKLKAYEKGELTGEDLASFEQELEMIEQHLNEDDINQPLSPLSKREQRILSRGKWKARIMTTLFVLSFMFVGFIGISLITNIYYAMGNPDEGETLRNVVEYTSTITDPYGYLGSTSIEGNPLFGLDVITSKKKQVGDEITVIGESKAHFLFSFLRTQEQEHYGDPSNSMPAFYPPQEETEYQSDWERLEQLPEETVTTAYISFQELLETKEVFQLFEDRDLELLWLTVFTEQEKELEDMVYQPIGFPTIPIWLEEDFVTHQQEEKEGWFGSQVTVESQNSPSYQYGDANSLHEQFKKVLHFLSNHERSFSRLTWMDSTPTKVLDYLDKNGITHYGVVVTGPSKELLALRENEVISILQIDEVKLWNWTER